MLCTKVADLQDSDLHVNCWQGVFDSTFQDLWCLLNNYTTCFAFHNIPAVVLALLLSDGFIHTGISSKGRLYRA